MTKHTPGPFTVGEMVRQSIRIEEPERTAALVLVEPGRVRPAEAAAALFAAAPDLLAALELMLSDYRTEGCRVSDCEICRKSEAAKYAASAAIAKAEGRG